jgi:Type I phosphodiesterase / nucleotide pyrophosphatase
MPPVLNRVATAGLAARAILLALLLSVSATAEVKRIVVIKIDGLPERLVEKYVSQPADGGRSGHSRLPWIQHVFAENGTWLENFYVRGLSLSAPSWSLLDTGRHLEVRGNAEYDRYTLVGWDYLNFFPFYLAYGFDRAADMPGVELLDDYGVPLLIDRFPYRERYQSFQLFQRGARLTRLSSMLTVKFTKRPVKDIFDEWETGFSMSDAVGKQMEQELLEKLKDPNVRYLDLYSGDYDHVAHLTTDRVAQFHVIEAIDSLVGRVWTAIQATPLAASTALVLVSDHGMNTEDSVYSQGYNLIDWFNSPAGGSHHVETNRHPMTEFKLKGLDPFVSEVISPSASATYLAGESSRYPTCVLDLDGNERASIGLRNNSLNIVQILLNELMHKRVSGAMRRATIDALFSTLNRVRPVWQRNIDGLDSELRGFEAQVNALQEAVNSQPKKWTREQKDAGLDDDAARKVSHLVTQKLELRGYTAYVAVMRRLLALDPADFDPGKFKMEDLIPRKSLGEPNSIYDLQNYVTGLAAGGLVLSQNGSLDMERSLRHVDYFHALSEIGVRNNVQKEVAPRPIDFVAVAVNDAVSGPQSVVRDSNVVWLWRSVDRQALIETRRDAAGTLEIRYSPVAHLAQDSAGSLKYDRVPWSAGLPLEIFEDPLFNVTGDRAAWLNEWHSERDWLRAVHRTKYSNGVIGIVEAMLLERSANTSSLLERQRQLRRPDMIAFANDHWNFNVRGFNPGGNHGSFLRSSTHSVLMFAGGADTGIPRALRITEPYDSLSFVPTVLSLMNRAEPSLPGPVIQLAKP